jgi:hypothetical protein
MIDKSRACLLPPNSYLGINAQLTVALTGETLYEICDGVGQ